MAAGRVVSYRMAPSVMMHTHQSESITAAHVGVPQDIVCGSESGGGRRDGGASMVEYVMRLASALRRTARGRH